MYKTGWKYFFVLNGFHIILNVSNIERWHHISPYLCLHHTTVGCTCVIFDSFFENYITVFVISYISWRLSGKPEDSIATVPWTTARYTILVPHGCKCIWMALVWRESCSHLWTGSSEPSVWAAPNGTSSNLRCHLDPQLTQLSVQCLTEYSTFCEPTGTCCHHGCVCSQSH